MGVWNVIAGSDVTHGHVADNPIERCCYLPGMRNHPAAFGDLFPAPAFQLGFAAGLFIGALLLMLLCLAGVVFT